MIYYDGGKGSPEFEDTARRFGNPVNPQDEIYDYPRVDRQNFGSNTRYNQLQNHPYNTIPRTPAIEGYDTEDYIEQLMDGRPNNIMDIDALMNTGRKGMTLNDIFAGQFGSVTRRNQLQNYPNNTYDYTPEEARYMSPNNIDDILFYLRGLNE